MMAKIAQWAQWSWYPCMFIC